MLAEQTNNLHDRYRWSALALMAASYACHSIDRQVIAVVLESIKHEYGVTDRTLGVLGGFAYTGAFALACLPMGWLVDRVNRRKLLTVLLTVWSGLTLACGFAGNFLSLLLMRMGVGFAEAGGQPTCLALIADFFQPKERSSAIGLFYLSPAAGIAASFVIGGVVAAHWGWRAAFLVAGVPGLLIALTIFLSLREPPRGGVDHTTGSATPLLTVIRQIYATPALLHIVVAMTLSSFTITAMWLWVTSLFVRVHHMGLSHIGLTVGLAAGCSALGSAVAGRIGGQRAQRSLAAQLQVPLVSSLLCAACGVALALTPSLTVAVTFLMATAFCMGAFLGPSYSVAMTLVPAGTRGSTAALFQLLINLLGSGLGPVFTGWLSDYFGGTRGLPMALAITLLVNLWAAFHYWIALRRAKDHFARLAAS
jgi:MFS family permease